MHIYVASSWRNTYYPDVVAALRNAGHEVYDFRNPPTGNPVTSGVWQMNSKGWTLNDSDFWADVSSGQLTFRNK